MSDPTVQTLSAEVATLRAQLQWADASILSLVQAVELLDRSVHRFEATHPATSSEQVQLLLLRSAGAALDRPHRDRSRRRDGAPGAAQTVPSDRADAATTGAPGPIPPPDERHYDRSTAPPVMRRHQRRQADRRVPPSRTEVRGVRRRRCRHGQMRNRQIPCSQRRQPH
jgi:hypothetical protein